jgi:hypothetical protein
MPEWSVAGLLAENEQLKEALRPFAACQFPDGRADTSFVFSTMTSSLKVGDFRRAKRVLDAGE